MRKTIIYRNWRDIEVMDCAGIYVIINRKNGKCYVGKDKRLGSRAKKHLALKDPNCRAIHNAIKKHNRDAFGVELIPYPNISDKALRKVERWKIRQLRSHRSQGGYNILWGGEGFDSETIREIQRKRVANGTHHFLDSEFQSKINNKRVADGTHNFQSKEFHHKQREIVKESNHKRIADGTHNFLGENNPSRKRVADGTHHLLGGELQRKRVADGTHHFLGGEVSRKTQRKRLEDGTHHFFDSVFKSRRAYLHRLHYKNQRREFYRWVSVILTAKSVCEERIYHKRIRDGFFDKEIPNTSKSEQLNLF